MNIGGGVGIWISEKTDFERVESPFVDKVICLTINLLTLENYNTELLLPLRGLKNML